MLHNYHHVKAYNSLQILNELIIFAAIISSFRSEYISRANTLAEADVGGEVGWENISKRLHALYS